MPGFEIILQRASANPRRIVLPEGEDPRVIEAAIAAQSLGTAKPVLLGSPSQIHNIAASINLDASELEILDPANFEQRPLLAEKLHLLRQHKGMTLDTASEALSNNLDFACMLLRESFVDGCVAGAVYSLSLIHI